MNTEQQQQQHSIFLWMYTPTENVKMAAVYLNFLTYFVLHISLTKMSWVIKLRVWTIHNEAFHLKFICFFCVEFPFNEG